MSLPPDYLTYPNRHRGQDIDLYTMQYATGRKKISLPHGKKLALSIIVPLEYFMLNPSGVPFKHPGAMVTPYPDLRHYTTRDYGNRIGVYRLLRAFIDNGVKVTFTINAALLEQHSFLINAIQEDGHEIAAHGWDTDSIHWGDIDHDVEQLYISRTREAFDKAGLSPKTWMSPARQQSFNTPDLIAEAGFKICLDWEIDSIPIKMRTKQGELYAMPLSTELDDRIILQTKHHPEHEWRDQILEAASMMCDEADKQGAQCLGFTMTPYIAGQPFRMWAVRKILESLTSNSSILISTVQDVVERFNK